MITVFLTAKIAADKVRQSDLLFHIFRCPIKRSQVGVSVKRFQQIALDVAMGNKVSFRERMRVKPLITTTAAARACVREWPW
jgi:hypothetical protein